MDLEHWVLEGADSSDLPGRDGCAQSLLAAQEFKHYLNIIQMYNFKAVIIWVISG